MEEGRMRVVVSQFMSLDGVIQAPGGPQEDTSGGFRHGGWSMPFFDPEVRRQVINEFAERGGALLQGRRTYQVSASAWPQRGGIRSPIGSTASKIRAVGHALREGSNLEADEAYPWRRPCERGG